MRSSRRLNRMFATLFCATCLFAVDALAQRQMESLGRGLIAVKQGEGKDFVGWRLLRTDPEAMAVNLYRATDGKKPVKLNDKPLTQSTSFIDAKADPVKPNAYFVRPVMNGREQAASRSFTVSANAPARQY